METIPIIISKTLNKCKKQQEKRTNQEQNTAKNSTFNTEITY